MNEIIKTVDDCCERTAKMIDKTHIEEKKEEGKETNGLLNKQLEDPFNKVQNIAGLLHDNEGIDPENVQLNFSCSL